MFTRSVDCRVHESGMLRPVCSAIEARAFVLRMRLSSLAITESKRCTALLMHTINYMNFTANCDERAHSARPFLASMCAASDRDADVHIVRFRCLRQRRRHGSVAIHVRYVWYILHTCYGFLATFTRIESAPASASADALTACGIKCVWIGTHSRIDINSMRNCKFEIHI